MAILKRVWGGVATMLLVWLLPAHAQAPEYQVKAAMIANFGLFVEWPPEAFTATSGNYVVCVLGEDPFGSWLEHELSGMSIGQHPVEIRHPEAAEQARHCHLAFISRSEQPRLDEVLAELRSASVLSVSDIENFTRQGGMIGFVVQGNKLRFELNANAVAEVGLKVDSKLKRVALAVE